MGGIFGVVSDGNCSKPLFYGTDYHSHLGTENARLAAHRAIRDLEGGKGKYPEEYLDHRSKRYRNMVEWIRRDLDVTSLKYLHIEEMVAAIGLPKEQLCLHCW